jgi:regulator of sigma E protease
MIAVTVIIGLLGLGLVVIVHEYGHLLAARLMKIEVEAFAVGWGRPILRFRRKGIEYRINIFPVGGYCKLKGEDSFKQAIENKLDAFPHDPGSLFSVKPLKRVLTYAAGPLFNLIFAVLLFSAVWAVGYEYVTSPNRIIIASEYRLLDYEADSGLSPAEEAGLQTGDVILRIGNQSIENFHDLQQALAASAGKRLPLVYEREGKRYETAIVPALDRSTGSGYIGVYSWSEPVITAVLPGSPEDAAGFLIGDRILSVEGHPVRHTLDFYQQTYEFISGGAAVRVAVQRGEREAELTYIPAEQEEGAPVVQLGFPVETVVEKADSLFDAVAKGVQETLSTFSLAVRSIGMLFKGIDLQEAVAGPIKITYLVGEAAAAGFSRSFLTGVRTLLQLLGFISVALGFANLLPIPALDGGQIVVAAAESITGKLISPRRYYILQIIGFTILFSLLFLTVFNDIRYLIG